MKLKKIKLLGFKSFADKVTLEFHEGVTAIVGPNGCGKSNIADAFRWVMGEQSAKSMRGGKMEDVLFAGTVRRKPLNLAEVTLVFENCEEKVPLPYREIEIIRRYHRDKEAEYWLNGNPVRLRDIQSILIDVGIGKQAYAIFEQGKIDQIIQLGPQERRSIFEEAAGILKFLIHRREAEKKLADVELNVSRLKDIHDEVQREIDQLIDQAKEATEYQNISARLATLEEESLCLKIASAKKRQGEQLRTEVSLKDKLEGYSRDFAALKINCEALRKDVESQEEELQNAVRELYQQKALIDIRAKERQTLSERLSELKKKQERLAQELIELSRAKEMRRKEMQLQKGKYDELSSGLQEKETSYLRAKEAFVAGEQEVTKIRKERDKAQEAFIAQIGTSAQISSQMREKAIRVEGACENQKRWGHEREQVDLLLEQMGLDEVKKRDLLEAVDRKREELQRQFVALDVEMRALAQEKGALEDQLNRVLKGLLDQQARENVLLKMQQEKEGVSNATKALLEAPLKLKGLWEFVDIQPGFEKAVNAILAPYADTLVAASHEELEQALQWAAKEGLSDFSIVVIKKVETLTSPLLEQVKVNDVTCHFLGGKKVVKTLKDSQGGTETYCLDGFYIDACGVLFQNRGKESSLFLREAELKALSQSIRDLEKEAAAHKTLLQSLKEHCQKKGEKRDLLDHQMRSLEMERIEKNFQLQKNLSEQEKEREKRESCEEQRRRIEAELKKLQEELLILKDKSGLEERALQEAAEAKESSQKSLEESLEKCRGLKERLLLEEARYNEAADGVRKGMHALNLLEVKDQESVAQERRGVVEQREIETSLQILLQRENELKSGEGVDEQGYERSASLKSRLERELALKREGFKEALGQASELEKQCRSQEQKVQQVELALAQIGAEMAFLRQEYGERYPGREASEKEGSFEKMEREIKKYKEVLTSFRQVNLSAPESLESHRERAGQLQREMGDLSNGADELRQIMATLADESRKLFVESFEAIRANFKKNFQILFNGGEADLELTHPDDVLASGVDIVAKPPGKAMRSIQLLSGGEKCLAAMALLFSIFEVKAAPFCILDEIDAPLDDTNVERFCAMVKHFADCSQFILITHNKRTMAMADRLYGVSMEEKGVSKLLRMEFQHQTAQEIALV